MTESTTTEVEPETEPEVTPPAPAEAEAEFTPTHVVLRRFHGAGTDLAPGEVVDGSGWRGAANLVSMRYLRPLGYEDPKEFVTDGERHFIDDDTFLAYIEATDKETAA